MIQIKRAYEAASPDDGFRILVDRLWPRGVAKEEANIYQWAKNLAPSTELRKWFGHDPNKWEEFQGRYLVELENQREKLAEIAKFSLDNPVTLVFAAKDEMHNEAVVLLQEIRKLAKKPRSAQQK